jgi:diacylglycerol kinase family enzyme
MVVTEKPRKLMAVIREMPELLQYNVIASCGGDGIFHELVNGILTRKDWERASKIPLAVIPAGEFEPDAAVKVEYQILTSSSFF